MGDGGDGEGPLVLVIEDDALIREIMVDNLEADGFRVGAAGSGAEGARLLDTLRPDILILDIMLPDTDGYDFCRRLRGGELVPDPRLASMPVLMLTARAQDEDELAGFGVGADDYMTKPFNPLHLSARLRAILRRAQDGAAPKSEVAVRSLSIDLAHGVVRCGGTILELTPIERALLLELARQVGQPLSREALLERVWKWEVTPGESGTRTVDVHINRLRGSLIAADPACDGVIRTIRGIGYALQAESAP